MFVLSSKKKLYCWIHPEQKQTTLVTQVTRNGMMYQYQTRMTMRWIISLLKNEETRGKGKTKREERKAITTMLVIVWFLSWFFVWFLVLLMRRITNSINLQLLCYLLAKTVPPGTWWYGTCWYQVPGTSTLWLVHYLMIRRRNLLCSIYWITWYDS